MKILAVTLQMAICALGLSLYSAPATAAGDNQWYEMKTAMGTCLDVPSGRTQNGARMQMWPCNGATAQMWRYEYRDTWKAGRILRNAASWQCLDLPNANIYSGAPIQQWDCTSNNPQLWLPTDYRTTPPETAAYCRGTWCQIEFTGAGRLKSSGYCLDVPGGSGAWGIKVQLWRCNNFPAQAFAHNPK